MNVDHVNEALVLVKQRAADLKIDGEFQADAAIIPSVGAKKVKQPSEVVGQANVLIFPDLNSGNIAYKLTQYMAGAKAIGPFLQGFAKPISDLSRGATVEDIVATTAICLAQVAYERSRIVCAAEGRSYHEGAGGELWQFVHQVSALRDAGETRDFEGAGRADRGESRRPASITMPTRCAGWRARLPTTRKAWP